MGKQLQAYGRLFDDLKKGNVRGLYLVYGPEEFVKKEFIRALLDAALPDGNRAFNLDIVYGDEFDRLLFDDRVGSFPLFTQRRVVILRNFQDLSNANKDHVIQAVERLSDSVVLVVETSREKLDTARLKKLKAAVDKRGASICFGYLDEPETIQRLMSRFQREGYRIDPGVLDLLVESVGTRLIDLTNEVDKIFLAAGEKRDVDRKLVTAVVGRYRTENLFSLLDVITKKNPAVTIRKLGAILDGGEEPVYVLSMLLKRITLLLQVRAFADEAGARKTTGRAISDAMGISPFYAEVLRKHAAVFEREELEILLENLRWVDLKIKTTQLAAKGLIEEAFLASHTGKRLASADVSS